MTRNTFWCVTNGINRKIFLDFKNNRLMGIPDRFTGSRAMVKNTNKQPLLVLIANKTA